MFFICRACDIGEPTMNGRMQTQSDGTGLSSNVLTTSPSSLEDEGVGEGFHGRVVGRRDCSCWSANVDAVTTSKPAATKMDTPPRSDTKDGCFRPSRRGPQGLALIGDGPRWVSVAGGAIRWKMSLSRF